MAHNVVLPQWGMEMGDGTVVKWLKKEADTVIKGEPLVEIETAKINSEVEAPASGVLTRILVSEGSTVDVGTVLAVIAAPGEKVEVLKTRASTPSIVARAAPALTGTGAPSMQVEPRARRLAKDSGIDLASVRGTGPGGRVTVVDVESAAAGAGRATVAPAIPEGAVELTRTRRIIAERMLRSSQETASLTLTTEADVTEVVKVSQALREKGVGPLAIIIKAVAESLKEHHVLNAHIWGFHTRYAPEINIGVAVAVEQGLVVPVVHHADGKSVEEIALDVRELATKAREGKLSYQDVSGGTFTVSNLGPHGVDTFTHLINQPEVAILGTGRIREKPAIYRGEIAQRSMMWLSLTFDHRICDGVPAAQFLEAVSRLLENTASS